VSEGLGEAAAQQAAFTRALRFAVAASRILTTAGQQPASFHQAAISRIQRQVEQAIDQSAQQAIRTAAETATLDQLLAEQPQTSKTDTFPPCIRHGQISAKRYSSTAGRWSPKDAQNAVIWMARNLNTFEPTSTPNGGSLHA
jgi:hypothetical protein